MTALPLLRRVATLAGLALAGLVLLAVGVRLAASQAPGRWIVADQLEGREIPGLGRVSISGVRGDPLSRLRIDQLTLSDDDGIWLTAEDIRLDWQARSLLSRPINIEAATIDQVTITRQPVLADRPNAAGEAQDIRLPELPAINLDHFSISRLDLAAGIAGPQALLALEASARLRANTSRLTMNVERLDAAGDRLTADFVLDQAGVNGTLTATGEPDGTLAALLRMPGRAVRLDGQVDGDPTHGEGRILLTGDAERWADAEISWDANVWQAMADVELARWGLVPEPLAAEIAEVHATADGSRDGGFGIGSIVLETAESRLVLRDMTSATVMAEFEISPALVDRLSGQRVGLDSLAGHARIERAGAVSMHIEPVITGLIVPGARIDDVTGGLDLSFRQGRPRLELDLNLDALRTGTPEIDALAGDRVRISGVLADDSDTTGWLVEPGFSVRSDAITMIADGHLPSGAQWPVGSASITVADLGLLHPELAGSASADIGIGPDRAIELTADARDASWPADAQGLLNGLMTTARLEPTETGWDIAALNARSPAMDLTLTGYFESTSDWQAGGDLALSGALPVAALEIDGELATAFRLVRDREALRLRSVTTTQRLQGGPVILDGPRLGIRGQLSGSGENAGTALEWVFTAEHNGRDMAFDGALRRQNGDMTLTVANGRVNDIALTGSARVFEDQLTIAMDAERDQLMSLSAGFVAGLDDLAGGTLDAELALEPQRLGAADLNMASLSLSGPLSGLAVTSRVEGRMRSNFDLSATGEIVLAEDGASISLSPSGKWAAHNWATEAPIRVATGPDGVAASAAFTLGGGRLDLDLRTAGASPIANLTIDNLPVGVLADIAAMPATQGTVSGAAELRESDGFWRGTARLDAAGLLAGDLPDMPEITLHATASIDDEARVHVSLTGGGLEATSDIHRAGPTTDITRPLGNADTALSGLIEARGELMALAALLLPSDILLEAGRIDGRIALSGTVGAPHLDGTLSLREGRVNAATAGSLVTDSEIDLTLTETGIELTRLSARDNREGLLSGSGRVDLDGDGARTGSAHIEFQRFVAVHRPALTLQASGDVDLTLDADGLLVGGDARIDQLRTQPTLNGAASIPQLQVIEINLPKDRRALNEARLPIRLDYRVRANNGLYISSRAFTSEWGIDLHVTGPESKPSLYGTASLVGGTAFVFNRRFSLADGTVTFDGAPGDARVDLTAIHARTGFRASARVTGSVQAPTITLSSDPALPEDEIIARLLFDQSVNELGALEAAQLAAQLSGQSLLDVVGQLRDLAGIDRLDISTGANGELSVVGGRRFGDNVYVEIGSTGAAAINEALIEWALTPDLSVLSRVSADTDASVAIRWRRDY
ncbi:translocation/assembly module TamB domain-containing protein [Maricaulis maris]|uniref:Translocation and assembly module TamB n=1 Tax=Maricaulis maris TaxID=74318 RepID=A0A495D2V0_9PROT|nr:translocation/assembly module TamB domain-containing protein [Maricaulis maris]RKQ96098.1 translocation and assembly module TamB [Maricaulis maris]